MLLLLWAYAIPSAGPLSALSPVGAAFADKGSGGGGSRSGGGGSDHSGSGGGDSDGGGGGSDDGGGDNSGSGRSGGDKKGSETEKAEKAEKAEKHDVQRFLDRLQHGGSVAYASVTASGVEVRYSDGWSEAVSGGRYRLVDGRQRVVADRPAKKSDLKRLSAAAATR